MINKSLKELNTEVLKSALVEYAENHKAGDMEYRHIFEHYDFVIEEYTKNQPEDENVTRSELEGILLEVFKNLEKNNCARCLEVKEKLASKYNLR